MIKSLVFVSKLQQAGFIRNVFSFWWNLIQFRLFAVHHEKSFVHALFKAPIDHLFDNLESGKSLEKVLNFGFEGDSMTR